jgi:large repetitive protein
LPDLQSLLGPVKESEPPKPVEKSKSPAFPEEPPQTLTDLEESVHSPHLEAKLTEKPQPEQAPTIEAHSTESPFLPPPPSEPSINADDTPSAESSTGKSLAAEPIDDNEEGIRAGGMHVIEPLPHTDKPLPPLPTLEPPVEPSAPA